ncbi:MAG: GAF domain-containing protein [Solirubrobacteraceae bacterium]
MAATTDDVRSAVQRLAGALLEDVDRITARSVARMQELLPSYANVPADALFPVTLTNTRNLLEAVLDPDADLAPADRHFRHSGETRLTQRITADEMLQAWRIGLETVREEAHPLAKRLEVTDAALLEFVEATLQWGDIGMRSSAAAHREGEMRKLERLAAEQAALRRVAELVARQAPPEQVFALVNEELCRVLGVDLMARTVRFESDGTATILAAWGGPEDLLAPGTNTPRPEGGILDQVLATGRPGRVDDYARLTGPLAMALRAAGIGSAAAGPIVVDGRTWGAMAVSSGELLPPGTEHRVAQFSELVSTAISNIESRARVEQLAAEQAALRRVATLVARTPASEQIFSTVAREVASVLNVPGVIVQSYEADGTILTFGEAFGPELAGAQQFFAVGSRMPLDPGSLAAQVFETQRPARLDDLSTLPGTIGALARAAGLGSGCAGPIMVNGALWGKMCVFSRVGTVLPAGTENRLNDFIELVATAIANYESRAKVERLAAEQSALRRVATLVAREHSPDELFESLVEELGVLLEVDATAILRYEADASVTVLAGWSDGAITIPVGVRLPLEGENLSSEVHRTGLPARKAAYGGRPGVIAATVRELGIRSAVASPIVVEGVTWGVIAVLSRRPEALPSDTEARIAEFTQQAGLAVANAKSRSDLAQSRARIVRAADEARRRFERDLHDGAQQRLVSLGLELRTAEATVPPELGDLRDRLSRLATRVNDVLDDLRELSRGIHPAVLSEDGLGPALASLALRSGVPVDLSVDLGAERFEEPIEVTVYYVTSEALTNTAKHAQASRAEVRATRRDGWLELTVSDDGQGGVDASRGSGLTGLVDRVEAIGGTIHIDGRQDLGTAIHVKLPIRSIRG